MLFHDEVIVIKKRKYRGIRGQFIVNKYLGFNSDLKKMYEIIFLDTGTKCIVTEEEILSALALDVFDVSLSRLYGEHLFCKFFEFLHEDMVKKLEKSDSFYRSYNLFGRQGYTLCEKWKKRDVFLNDIPKLKGYPEMMTTPAKYRINYRVLSLYERTAPPERKEFNLANCYLGIINNVWVNSKSALTDYDGIKEDPVLGVKEDMIGIDIYGNPINANNLGMVDKIE